jgi:hypothetical protein
MIGDPSRPCFSAGIVAAESVFLLEPISTQCPIP